MPTGDSRFDDNRRPYDLVLEDATLFEQSGGSADIAVRGGVIAAIAPAHSGLVSARTIHVDGSLVVPTFTETHFHLDKTLTRDRFGAVTYKEGFEGARKVKTGFTPEDVESRACEALRLTLAHGTGALRAQCDIDSFTELRSFEGLLRARERFADLVDVQIVAFPQEGIVADPKSPALLREAIDMGADLVGALPEREANSDDQRTHLETVFDIAEEKNVPIDAHSDYVDDPGLKTLEILADITIERGLKGRVTAGHCNALSMYPDDEAKRVIDKLIAAEIGVIVMPMANLQMLGGPGRTPYNRGSSRMAELLDAGLTVAVASDNMFDIWYRFNRMDPAELALFACLSGALRTDPEVKKAFDMVNANAARVFGRGTQSVAVGEAADLVVLNASTLVDFFRNVPGRRIVIRKGRVVAGIEATTWSADA